MVSFAWVETSETIYMDIFLRELFQRPFVFASWDVLSKMVDRGPGEGEERKRERQGRDG